MRTPLYVGIAIALALITFDTRLFLQTRPRVALTYVSAQESLALPAATSTLGVAPESAWGAPQPVAESPAEADVPSVAAPTRAAAELKTIAVKKAAPPRPDAPVRLVIPSIGLDTTIDPMGLNARGEMDVPPGSSPNVGWYKGGPKPGEMGSAVIDAHVFAAFENLRHLKVGEEVIVDTSSGQRLRFIAEESTVFKLSEITPQMLFGRGGGRWLNLITCAGAPVGDTYSHRLIVYTKFVEEL